MFNKTKSITEKIPHPTSLPDGLYNAVWGGYVIELTHKGRQYELASEEGVRGMGIKVVVQIENGIATFDTVQS